MPKAEVVFRLTCFDSVCVRERGSTYYTEQDHTLVNLGSFFEVSAMKHDNNEDNLLNSSRLDEGTLQLLQVQAEARRVS